MLHEVPVQMKRTASQWCSLGTFCWGQTWIPSTSIPVCTWFHPGHIFTIKWQAQVIYQEGLEGTHPPTGAPFIAIKMRRVGKDHSSIGPAVGWKLRWDGSRCKRPEIQAKPRQPENLSDLCWRWLCPKRTCQHGLECCQMSQQDCAQIRMASHSNQNFNPTDLRHSQWGLECCTRLAWERLAFRTWPLS